MSQENVEKLSWVLEQLFDCRRIHPDLLAADAEWVNPHDAVEPGTRSGAECFNGAIATVFATWDEVHFDTERVIDSGDSPHGQIWTFRDGQAIRMHWFRTAAACGPWRCCVGVCVEIPLDLSHRSSWASVDVAWPAHPEIPLPRSPNPRGAS